MVDTALFVGMSGAKDSMRSLQVISNNLANANTIGFQADYETMKSYSDTQPGLQTRSYSAGGVTSSDFKPGPIIQTGGELDIAIMGPGFIAVQTKDGQEGYTRAGNLKITPEGLLLTSKGDMVLSDKGVINIPLATKLNINEFGEITAQLPGESAKQLAKLGNIKLVHIPPSSLQKGEDGLFHLMGDSEEPKADHTVKIQSGALEGSNVNSILALTQLIDVSRQFEMHTKMMKNIEDNSSKSNQLLDGTA